MARKARIVVLGDVDEHLRVTRGAQPDVRDVFRQVEAWWQSGENRENLWVLVPSDTGDEEIPESLAPRVRRVRDLYEATRFAGSLGAGLRTVETLLSGVARDGTVPESPVPLQATIWRHQEVFLDVSHGRFSFEAFHGWEDGQVDLYDREIVRIFETPDRDVRWMLVLGNPGSGKSTWLRFLEQLLREEGAAVFRVDARRYRWGNRGWAEEIARAFRATHGLEHDDPVILRFARWLEEGGVARGVILLDGAEKASPRRNWGNVLRGLHEAWPGWVVLAGRSTGVRGAEAEPGSLSLRAHVLEIDTPQPNLWLETAPEEEALAFRNWFVQLGLPSVPYVVKPAWEMFRREVRGKAEAYEKLIHHAIRRGMETVFGDVDEKAVRTAYRVLACALSVTLGSRLGSHNIFTSLEFDDDDHSVSLFSSYVNIPAEFRWGGDFSAVLEWCGRTVAGETWEPLRERVGPALRKGLETTGIWTVMEADAGECEVKFEILSLRRFLCGAGYGELEKSQNREPVEGMEWEEWEDRKEWWAGYLWARLQEESEETWLRHLWENDLGKFAVLVDAAPSKVFSFLNAVVSQADPETFLERFTKFRKELVNLDFDLCERVDQWFFVDQRKWLERWIQEGSPSVWRAVEDLVRFSCLSKALSREWQERIRQAELHNEEGWARLSGFKNVEGFADLPGGTLSAGELWAKLDVHLQAVSPEEFQKTFDALVRAHRDVHVRALARWLVKHHEDVLITWLQSKKDDVRIRTFRLLQHLADEAPEEMAAFLTEKWSLVEEALLAGDGLDWAGYTGAIRRLIRFSRQEIADAFLQTLLRHAERWMEEGPERRLHALWLLAEMARESSVVAKVTRIFKEKNLGDIAVAAMENPWLQEASRTLLETIVLKATNTVWIDLLEEHEELVELLLQAESPAVRKEVATLIQSEVLRNHFLEGRDWMKTLLQDDAEEVRRRALEWMRWQLSAPELERYFEARGDLLQKLLCDRSKDVRKEAFAVLRDFPGESFRAFVQRHPETMKKLLESSVREEWAARVFQTMVEKLPAARVRAFVDKPEEFVENLLPDLLDYRDPRGLWALAGVFPREVRHFLLKSAVQELTPDALSKTRLMLCHLGRLIRTPQSWPDMDVPVLEDTLRELPSLWRQHWEAHPHLWEEGLRDPFVRVVFMEILHTVWVSFRSEPSFVEKFWAFWIQRPDLVRMPRIWNKIQAIRHKAFELAGCSGSFWQAIHLFHEFARTLPEKFWKFWEERTDLLWAWARDRDADGQWFALAVLAELVDRAPESVLRTALPPAALAEQLKGDAGFGLREQHGWILRLMGAVFLRNPGLARSVKEEDIPFEVGRWMVRAFRILDEARREDSTGVALSGSERVMEPVRVAWGDTLSADQESSGEVGVACVPEEGGIMEVKVRWWETAGKGGKVWIRGAGDRRTESLLQHVWTEFWGDRGKHVSVQVNAGGRPLRGSVLVATLLGLALASLNIRNPEVSG